MSGMRSLSQSEIQLIKSSLKNPRDYCLFVLGYRTGFRISELLSLSIDSVWNSKGVKDSVKVWRRNMKGAHSSREVLLHSEAKEAIQKYLDTLIVVDIKSPLFRSKKGGAIGICRGVSIYKEIASKLGLQGSIATHSARKTYSYNMYKKLDHDLVSLQKAMGHASITSTIRYLEPDQDRINKALLED